MNLLLIQCHIVQKKFREFIKKEFHEKSNKEGGVIYNKQKKQSIIYEIIKTFLSNIKEEKEQNKLINFCFDYLTTLDKIFLYNLSKGKYD